jgi:hypothetical protein
LVRRSQFVVLLTLTTLGGTSYPGALAQDSLYSSMVLPRLFGIPNARLRLKQVATFGSEFVAAKVAAETIRGLQYKLRMIVGVPIDGPTFFFGD